MATEDSLKKRTKNAKKKAKEESELVSSQHSLKEVNFDEANENVKKKNNKREKKSSVNATEEVNVKNAELVTMEDETHEISRGRKKLKIKKKKKAKTRSGIENIDPSVANEVKDGKSDETPLESELAGKKMRKSRKKKRNTVESVNSIDEGDENDDLSSRREKIREYAKDEVYEMSSGDEDYSRGMQKWITRYHQSRPGLKVLQERIDDFIMDHETQEEKERAEREAQAAEGGWTVVVHHKGRKKTTDAETGITVGSVAQASILDKMANKKKTHVGLNFYGFQKKEARMNEIVMLQSKFEQDKKRIQQMRAARKFRPY